MTIRVGINGFGRIGRLVVRAVKQHRELTLAHINEANAPATTSAHLLEFDTIHGRFDADVSAKDGADGTGVIEIDGDAVTHSSLDTPGAVDWAGADVDLVLECSGRFRTPDLLAPYLAQPAVGVGRLHKRHPLRHRGRAVHHGGRRPDDQSVGLVRQRVRLRPPDGRPGWVGG